MASRKRWLAFPIGLLVYAAGVLGLEHLEGILRDLTGWLWVLTYYPVFWGAAIGIPLLGAGATFLRPALPEPLRDPVLAAFIAWLLAFLGMLLGAILLGPPPGFVSVPG